jgi:hypothetical protein
MTNIKQLKEESINYFTLLLNDKSEAIKLGALILFSIYLTLKFIGGYDSTGGYDIRSEFCGYLMQFSFFAFLCVNIKSQVKDQENDNCVNNCSLKCLATLELLLSITNFLIVKSTSTYFIFKLVVIYASILMFLVLIRLIAVSNKKLKIIGQPLKTEEK